MKKLSKKEQVLIEGLARYMDEKFRGKTAHDRKVADNFKKYMQGMAEYNWLGEARSATQKASFKKAFSAKKKLGQELYFLIGKVEEDL